MNLAVLFMAVGLICQSFDVEYQRKCQVKLANCIDNNIRFTKDDSRIVETCIKEVSKEVKPSGTH